MKKKEEEEKRKKRKRLVCVVSESRADLFGTLNEDGSVTLLCGFPDDIIIPDSSQKVIELCDLED